MKLFVCTFLTLVILEEFQCAPFLPMVSEIMGGGKNEYIEKEISGGGGVGIHGKLGLSAGFKDGMLALGIEKDAGIDHYGRLGYKSNNFQYPQYSMSPPNGSGYVRQNGPAYIPQNSPAYIPQNGPVYIPQNGPAYMPQNGPAYMPQNGPAYFPQNGPAYYPQNGPAYYPQNGPAYYPQNGQCCSS